MIQGQANIGKALALGMIIVVARGDGLYALLNAAPSRWLQ